MAERQEHAFEYESRIILENNIIKSEGYTDKWDAFENDIPVSVKNIKLNSGVDFGDFKRQTLLNQDFYLYVGFWQTDKTNIVKEYKILVSFENWKKYFGDITIISDMIGEMKQISMVSGLIVRRIVMVSGKSLEKNGIFFIKSLIIIR